MAMESPSLPPLIRAMLRAGFYPHHADSVELRQTHTSYVLLAGDYVYKIKKPVRFPFLDYSTLEKRGHYCHEEIRLNRRKFATFFSALVLTAGLGQPGDSTAGVPTDQIRATVNRVLMILKDPQLNSDDAKEARWTELSKAIFPRFDFEEMAKRSLGSEWRRLTASEQKEFIHLFTALLKDSYVDCLESYRGDNIVYRRVFQDGYYADVGTKFINERGEEFAIYYRLNFDQSESNVYNVISKNTSIVNNYRSQFRRILGRSSFEELLQPIRDKVH